MCIANINVKKINYYHVINFIKDNNGEIIQDSDLESYHIMVIRFKGEGIAWDLIAKNVLDKWKS